MYKKGTIILVPFPFTDLSNSKVRPAVILSSNSLPGDDLVAAFISSNAKRVAYKTDLLISRNDTGFKYTGLKKDSIIKTNKLATLDKKIILGELGKLNPQSLNKLNKKIKLLFDLK